MNFILYSLANNYKCLFQSSSPMFMALSLKHQIQTSYKMSKMFNLDGSIIVARKSFLS